MKLFSFVYTYVHTYNAAGLVNSSLFFIHAALYTHNACHSISHCHWVKALPQFVSTNNILYLNVHPCQHAGYTCLSVYKLCVQPLCKCCKNENVTTGQQTNRQQVVGKRHIHPGLGNSQACWDWWLPGQTDVLPEQLWRWIYCLVRKKCVKESEKWREEVIKNTHGSLWWQCV